MEVCIHCNKEVGRLESDQSKLERVCKIIVVAWRWGMSHVQWCPIFKNADRKINRQKKWNLVGEEDLQSKSAARNQ